MRCFLRPLAGVSGTVRGFGAPFFLRSGFLAPGKLPINKVNPGQSQEKAPMSAPEAPKTFLEKAKGAAANVAANAKAAAQIAGKQAEHGKLTQMILPSAYWALGKDIHGAGRFRDEFGELFTKLDGLLSNIQSLKQAHLASDQPQKFTDRAKAAAGHAVDLTKAKAVEMEVNGGLRELGKRAYEKHGESAGAANMVQPIAQALARLETLDREIKALSESHAGGFLTPRRLLVGGGAVIALLVLFFVGRLFIGSGATGGSAGYSETSWDELAEIAFVDKPVIGNGRDITLAFSPDGKQLALCGQEKYDTFTFKVYDVAKQQQLSAIDLYADGTKDSIKMVGRGNFALNGLFYLSQIVGRKDSKTGHQLQSAAFAEIWDATNKNIIKTLPGRRWFISADGKRVASVPFRPTYAKDLSACQVKVCDVTTGEIQKSFPGAEPIAFSPDGKLLAITALPGFQQGENKVGLLNRSNVVSVRDLSTGEEVGMIKLEASDPKRPFYLDLMVFSPDSRILAVQDHAGKTVDIWGVSEKKLLKRLTEVPVDDSGTAHIAFSPDGRTLAVTGKPPHEDKTGVVLLIDWPSGKMAGLRCETWAEQAAFSPDGTTLAIGISKGTVKLFRQQAGTKGKLAFVEPQNLGLDMGEKKTPPVTLATYNQLTEGMTVDEVQQLIGGKAQKSEMDSTSTSDKFGIHRTFHSTHTYNGAGSPGATVTLFFEQSAKARNFFVLVRKQQQGLQ